MDDQFNVVVWCFPDPEEHTYVCRNVDGKTAVETAFAWTEKPAAKVVINGRPVIHKVMITDGGDEICFLWIWNHGVVFPAPDPVTGKYTVDDGGAYARKCGHQIHADDR